jgi:hypothetical protein
VAAAALAEAEAARAAALRELDAREAAAASELDVLREKLASARALNAQFEREPAEVAAMERHAALADEAVSAREKSPKPRASFTPRKSSPPKPPLPTRRRRG